jgi:hypothetical protein
VDNKVTLPREVDFKVQFCSLERKRLHSLILCLEHDPLMKRLPVLSRVDADSAQLINSYLLFEVTSSHEVRQQNFRTESRTSNKLAKGSACSREFVKKSRKSKAVVFTIKCYILQEEKKKW